MDSWTDAIAAYVQDQQYPTTAQILQNAVDISVGQTHNGMQRRCGRVMRTLGFEASSRRVNGRSTRVWVRTDVAKPVSNSLTDF